MRRNAVCKLSLIALVLALGLTGCMRQSVPDPHEQGYIRIVVSPSQTETQSISPKVIPDEATKVRIRVWHEETGFNAVHTVTIGNEDAVDIPVPEDDGYTVDAVSYYVQNRRPLALTGGRARDVSVEAKQVTTAKVLLLPWQADVTGDTTVEPEETFEINVYPTDGGGLLALQTFREATLHTSTTAFDDPEDALPLYPGSQGILFDDRIAFTSTAPDVNELTVLFVAALVEFNQNWKDTTLSSQNEHSLFIELPNRHTDEDLHQITIDPSAGGLVVEITSQEP